MSVDCSVAELSSCRTSRSHASVLVLNLNGPFRPTVEAQRRRRSAFGAKETGGGVRCSALLAARTDPPASNKVPRTLVAHGPGAFAPHCRCCPARGEEPSAPPRSAGAEAPNLWCEVSAELRSKPLERAALRAFTTDPSMNSAGYSGWAWLALRRRRTISGGCVWEGPRPWAPANGSQLSGTGAKRKSPLQLPC